MTTAVRAGDVQTERTLMWFARLWEKAISELDALPSPAGMFRVDDDSIDPASADARYYAVDEQGREPVPRWAITGYATVFNSPHQHRGRIDVFTADAFNISLAIDAPFAALIQHSYKNPIAATGVNLELLPDDHGLAFRIEIKGSDRASIAARMVETGQRVGMSVGYVVKASEDKTADGVPYRLITRAQLLEISIVEEGAVPQAYASLIDLDKHKTSLREDSRYGFLRSGEHVRDVEARVRRVTSALRTLVDATP